MAGDYQVPVQGEMKGWMGGGLVWFRAGGGRQRLPGQWLQGPSHAWALDRETGSSPKQVPSEVTHLYLSW